MVNYIIKNYTQGYKPCTDQNLIQYTEMADVDISKVNLTAVSLIPIEVASEGTNDGFCNITCYNIIVPSITIIYKYYSFLILH